MKRICCISSVEATSQVQEMLNLIRKHTMLDIIRITPLESIADFEVVIFVLSKDVLSDEFVLRTLKEASNLNKTFIPVILGGNFFTNWLLKRRYQGPDLRNPFLSLRKDDDTFAFLQQLASFGGSKILGDVYGVEAWFNVDLSCIILRNNEFIAESHNSKSVKITLYKGNHKLLFQSKEYPDLSTEVKIKVKNLSTPILKDVKIAKHRLVKKMAFSNGFYEGSLYLDERDGDGVFWFPNGDVYNGHWDKNAMSGVGTMTYSSGETYVGNWDNGKRHGHGKLIWSNAEYYEGEFQNDTISGTGTMRYSSGETYVGNWDNWKRHGHGKLTWSKAEYYEGEFLYDTITGTGTKRYSSGETYVGDWDNGIRHGHGKLTWRNAEYYEGEFQNDTISGTGKKFYNDGSFYNGSWSNGKYNGKGTKRFEDGREYVGDWVNGVQHGHGIEYDSNGRVIFEGKWKNGKKQTFLNKIINWWNSL